MASIRLLPAPFDQPSLPEVSAEYMSLVPASRLALTRRASTETTLPLPAKTLSGRHTLGAMARLPFYAVPRKSSADVGLRASGIVFHRRWYPLPAGPRATPLPIRIAGQCGRADVRTNDQCLRLAENWTAHGCSNELNIDNTADPTLPFRTRQGDTEMQVQPYLFFNGHCEEAIEFYRNTVGAEVMMLVRFKDSPEPDQPGVIPPARKTRSCMRVFASAIPQSWPLMADAWDKRTFKVLRCRSRRQTKRRPNGFSRVWGKAERCKCP